jgi:hypothetical protein
MRVMVMVTVKADQELASGTLPDGKALAEMDNFKDELVKAGVLLAAEGLKPSANGKRVKFQGAKRTVVDGPFTETKELLAGFMLWQVKSMDEAVEWVKRSPSHQGDVEIRPVFEADDFAPSDPSGQMRQREEEYRKSDPSSPYRR